MWCRLVTGEKAGQAQGIDWQQSDAPPGLPDGGSTAAPRPLYADAGFSQREEHSAAAAALRLAEQNITAAYQRGSIEGEAAANKKSAAQVQAKIEQLSRAIEQLATALASRSSGKPSRSWCGWRWRSRGASYAGN